MSLSLCLISLSRFIINLRQNDHSDDETLTGNGQSHSKIRYQPFLNHLIGNLGETLDFEAKYLETDDAETTGKDGSDDSTGAKRLSSLARGCRKTESGEVSGHDDPAILEEEDIQEVNFILPQTWYDVFNALDTYRSPSMRLFDLP